jgi:hypothetical protein
MRPGTVEAELADPAPGRRAGTHWVVLTGVAGGLAGAIAMAGWLMFCAEVADEPTAVPGIQSSTWTPITAITSFLFGLDAFHGDFYPLSILFGLAAHLFLGVVFGLVGVALITYTFAGRPGIPGAVAFGFAYGLVVEVLFRNIFVNWVQDVHTVADALPSWGWWVGHAFYGATLGLVAARLLSLGAPGVTPSGLLADEVRR